MATASQIWGGDDNGGQLVVWDLLKGTRLSVYTDTEGGFVFDGGADLVQWAPVGDRVAASFQTSGILVAEHGRPLIAFFSDDARDNPVRFSWLDGTRLYTDVGHVGTVPPSEQLVSNDSYSYPRIFEFRRPANPLLVPASGADSVVRPFHKNTATSSIVGPADGGKFLIAFNADTFARLYRKQLHPGRPNRKGVDEFSMYLRDAAWSDDGRRLAIPWIHNRRSGSRLLSRRGGVVVIDGDTGRQLADVTLPNSDSIRQLRWGPRVDGGYRLAVLMQKGPATIRLHVLAGARIDWSVDVNLAQPDINFQDAQLLDWSPSGDGLVMPWHDGTLHMLDATNGKPRATLATGIKPSGKERYGMAMGVMWARRDRLVVLRQQSLTFMTIAGERVAHHPVPT